MVVLIIRRGEVVRNDLESGDHRLHCELLRDTKDPGGGTEFRIISLMRWVARAMYLD